MTEIDFVRRIEEASFNAWPALNIMVYDGWLLRFANGYTKRANSANGLYSGKRPLDEKIAYCERIYRQQGQRPVFRLTPLAPRDDLDKRLQQRRYKRLDQTSVQLLDLNTVTVQLSARAEMLAGADGVDRWLRAFHELNPQRRDATTHKKMLQNILGEVCLMVLRVNKEIAACGLAVADGHLLGLFDIVTAADQRRLGYGRELTASLLAWGLSVNASHAYLQVMKENGAALGLYSKLGFQELYDYWYRVAADDLEEL